VRKTIFALVLFVACLPGCIGSGVRTAVKDNDLRCVRFCELMAKGETTRDQEQRFIQANGEAWKALAEKIGE
jgi:hypothetical protein